MNLQSYVTPICTFRRERGSATILKLLGTAFVVGSSGYLLTAGHVLRSFDPTKVEAGTELGIVGKENEGKGLASVVAPILNWELFPPPYDAAIFLTEYRSKTPLRLETIDVEVWRDVAAYGYPENALSGPAEAMRLNVRAHKGYIQRLMHPEDFAIGEHPRAFELSFPVGRGQSGSPLFIHQGDVDIVIGVCTGSNTAEIVEYENVEVADGGQTTREILTRREAYGIAHDLREVLDWTPTIGDGHTLMELGSIQID